MSYDFWLEIDSGGPEPVDINPRFRDVLPSLRTAGMAGVVSVNAAGEHLRCGNYTSNVSEMWTECLTKGAGRTLSLACLADRTCGDIVMDLTAAVSWGCKHISELREMNPKNSWGCADGAVTYLWDIQRMCERHPKATLRISR